MKRPLNRYTAVGGKRHRISPNRQLDAHKCRDARLPISAKAIRGKAARLVRDRRWMPFTKQRHLGLVVRGKLSRACCGYRRESAHAVCRGCLSKSLAEGLPLLRAHARRLTHLDRAGECHRTDLEERVD